MPKKKIQVQYVWMAVCLLAMACNNTKNENADNSTSDSLPATTVNENRMDTLCYLAVQDRDTILLQLYVADSLVTGRMQYDNFEIDGNIGNLQAIRQHNRMEGYFRFFAEGQWSVREIIFEEQPDGDLLQTQTNDMTYNSDTIRFTDKKKISFDKERVFKRTGCGQLHFGNMPQ